MPGLEFMSSCIYRTGLPLQGGQPAWLLLVNVSCVRVGQPDSLLKKDKNKITNFGQPTSLNAQDRASATLPALLICVTAKKKKKKKKKKTTSFGQRLEQPQQAYSEKRLKSRPRAE